MRDTMDGFWNCLVMAGCFGTLFKTLASLDDEWRELLGIVVGWLVIGGALVVTVVALVAAGRVILRLSLKWRVVIITAVALAVAAALVNGLNSALREQPGDVIQTVVAAQSAPDNAYMGSDERVRTYERGPEPQWLDYPGAEIQRMRNASFRRATGYQRYQTGSGLLRPVDVDVDDIADDIASVTSI